MGEFSIFLLERPCQIKHDCSGSRLFYLLFINQFIKTPNGETSGVEYSFFNVDENEFSLCYNLVYHYYGTIFDQ